MRCFPPARARGGAHAAASAIFAAAALLICAAAGHAQTTTTFVSGTDWTVTDPSGNVLGDAEYVAVNDSYPANQPPGTVIYNPSATGADWQANLSSIPGANWVWAPGTTGATPNASLAQYGFSQQFLLSGAPTAGTVAVAVDDQATVIVNGKTVGSTGSITDVGAAFAAQSSLTSFDILPYLTTGENTILILAQNGPYYFAGSNPDPDYATNYAGVVFGGSISSAAAPTSPGSPASTPEPASMAGIGLGAAGLGGLLLLRARRRAA